MMKQYFNVDLAHNQVQCLGHYHSWEQASDRADQMQRCGELDQYTYIWVVDRDTLGQLSDAIDDALYEN